MDVDKMPRKRAWSEYVELSKYFCGNLPRTSRSAPCIHVARTCSFSAASAPANLSLSWQLACAPVDCGPLKVVRTGQGHQTSGPRHCKNHRQLVRKSISFTSGRSQHNPKRMQRNRKAKSQKPVQPPQIVVVDAKAKHANPQELEEDQGQSPSGRAKVKPTVKRAANPKKSYGVPLCHRPTVILGTQQPYEPQCPQQYPRKLQQQQQPWEQHHHQPDKPLQHLSKLSQDQPLEEPIYAVPIESMYDKLKRGSRYCGNFYYK